MIVKVLFWLCVAAVFHSYLLFPITLSLLNVLRTKKSVPSSASAKTRVSVLISAFNEEEVIIEKLDSILKSDFPLDSIEILVGSDASTDQTNRLLKAYSGAHPENVRFFPFTQRRGKPNVINELVNQANGEILVLTDANVLLDTSTIKELVHSFSDPEVGLVDTQMNNLGMRKEGISIQEKAYISREVLIKNLEGDLWGTMMGPFGGCFAIRRELYQPVPANFLVDDFFLNMLVLGSGYRAINNPSARVYEDVSNDLRIEYRRKIRIATGNFQNLNHFSHLLWPVWQPIGYCFLSHKVLRWLGPHFLIVAFSSLIYLALQSPFYRILFIGYALLLMIPLLDFLLKSLNLHLRIVRFITHFLAMNLAMGVGFIRYLKGVRSNVWQPTKRHQ